MIKISKYQLMLLLSENNDLLNGLTNQGEKILKYIGLDTIEELNKELLKYKDNEEIL